MIDGKTIFDGALDKVVRGREGLNEGLPMGFKRLVHHLPNIQQGTYYLVGASTKIGKTSFADDCFLYNPYDFLMTNESDIELDVDYFSFEIDKFTKVIKGICRKIWKDYGILVNPNEILSRGKNYCSDEIYTKVLEYRTYFESMEDIVTMHDESDNATGINKYLLKKAAQNGKIIKKKIGTSKEGVDIMRFDRYIPNNPNKYWIVFIDHIALLKEERGFSTKQNIDKMSKYLVELRNNFNIIPVVIQQLNFDTDNDDRHKSKRLTPTLRDFGDSKYTTRDANVIMTLFDPSRYELERFQGYNIKKLGNTFRNLEILVDY
jgi:replicative DNA helicase